MPIEKIVDYYMDTTKNDYMKMKLAINCAPLLKNIKVSSMIVTKAEYNIEELIKETKIYCKEFWNYNDRKMIFLYRKAELEKHLEIKENKDFLRGYCYNMDSYGMDEVLERQAVRMREYHLGKKEFPHEVGILLGYPIKDVEGFINNKGENYKASGYWKVYDNPKQVLRLFEEFDKAKEEAVNQVLAGKKIEEIAV